MGLTHDERVALIDQYAAGPARLAAALATVPVAAHQWRPATGVWSAHEIVVHCADSETAAASRIRMLLAEPQPLIVGYDQDGWAVRLDYHAHPLALALAAVTAVRANTVPLLRATPAASWQRAGRHTESGPYTAEDWLRSYGAHLEEYAQQIAANLVAWQAHPSAAGGVGSA
ncbi:MAG: DinB family protein [Chloroflexi bacterium]|nr:DinB family protein [Chloroflexota bacterium]